MSASGLWRVTVLTKSVLAISIGIFGLLVAWTNLVAYDINFQFVQHVLSMDALASWAQNAAIMDRAIANPAFHQIAYAVIIFAEMLVGLLCVVGGLCLLMALHDSYQSALSTGKVCVLLGCGIGIGLWYLGFAVIGAEYFMMWASQWNGQSTAYTFAGFFLLAMIYVAQSEPARSSQGDGSA